MYCSNCGSNCPAYDLTSAHCGDTRYELGDRVKAYHAHDKYTWGTVEGVNDRDGSLLISCDDSDELEWFEANDVDHRLNHEVTACL